MHGVEEWVEPEYVMDRTLPVVYTITDENGSTFKRTHLKYHFHRETVDYEQKYSRMVDIIPRDKIVHGKLLDADCVLMDSAAVWETGVATMKRDPYFFVDVHNLK
jgi:aminoglycoside 3-N-acetyltransferase